MSRFTLFLASAVLMATGAAAYADQPQIAQDRLACAQVGIDPGSPAFAQCVVDLDQSVQQEQSVAGR